MAIFGAETFNFVRLCTYILLPSVLALQEVPGISIISPENNSFTLATLTQLSIRVEHEEWSEVCLDLFSVYFDKKSFGCFPAQEAETLQIGSLPYGRHQLRIQVKHKSNIGMSAFFRVYFTAVPILPTDMQIAENSSRKCSLHQAHHRLPILNEHCNPNINQNDIAIAVLVNRGGKSFIHALKSWEQSGLLALASENFIFLQEWPEHLNESKPYPLELVNDKRLLEAASKSKLMSIPFSVIGSHVQLGIGPAFSRLVEQASSKYILFIEEDFIVHSEYIVRHDIEREISKASGLLRDDHVHMVKLRHRVEPGLPFYPYVWKGHEDEMLTKETPYISNHSVLETIHWLIDPSLHFGEDIIWPCFAYSKDYFCTYSTHAGWSNNPFLAKRSFLMEHITLIASSDWTRTIEGAINLSPHLWDNKCFVIAQGSGIFTHEDIDGRQFSEQSPFENPFHDEILKRMQDFFST